MEAQAKSTVPRPQARRILVCQGTSCTSAKSEAIRRNLEQAVTASGLTEVSVDFVGCHGLCQEGPTVLVEPDGTFYTHVEPEDAQEIVHSHLVGNTVVERLLYRDPATGTPVPRMRDIEFFRRQTRLALANAGLINPERIEDSIAAGGYQALEKVLKEMSPEEVIETVRRSGLRGRGGAGFPVFRKWEICHAAPGNEKYLICNDRNTLEGDPHTLIEGMVIAAFAIGASTGLISFRAKSRLALRRLREAISQAEQHGYLGRNILNSGFDFTLTAAEGIGDFVCGEETALIATLEGRRGVPTPKPPYPAERGLWGKPTVVHNVKTLATLPGIIRHGPEKHAALGTSSSKGTAMFALTGKVANNGLVEVPMDMTLHDLIYEVGGGIPGGRRLKAVHIGGPTGGFIPPAALEQPVDYETIESAGAVMGSQAVVVLDDTSCIVDTAKFFITYAQSESCGKCIQCRWGLKQMADILEDVTSGRASLSDIDLLIELAEAVKAGSLCGLGKTAPNAVLSSIRHFRQEYVSHIKDHRCPAAVCKGLVSAPCSHTCPAGVDVPRYIRLVADRRYDDALAVIRERIPFPSVCGYVCIHPCETRCRRGQIDEPIAIKTLKRFVADHGKLSPRLTRCAPPSGKRVAVVGSGPAGLTAAYYLAKLGGHQVTVFEALPEAGGMMRVGIPRYRLPKTILDREIDFIRQSGVEIRLNTRVDSLDWLKEQGFDAIFLGLGAHVGSKMGIPGEASRGVMDCVTFLRETSLGRKVEVGRRVAVIGGGNAAIDASRTALRLGAREVTLLYRRTRDEMPAAPEEIADALKEGVHMEYLVAPTGIHRDNGHIELQCTRMQLGRMDASGRKRPEPLPGSEFTEVFDTVIAAIGQKAQVPASFGLELNRNGTIRTDPDTLATSIDGVFAGGDAVTGPASVIEAIAAGRKAAIAIDRYLGGSGKIEEHLAPAEELPVRTDESDEEPDAAEGHRPEMPELPLSKRLKSFKLVELGLAEATAVQEAQRCLKCDLEKE